MCIAADGVEPCLNLAQVGNSDETVTTYIAWSR